MFKKLSIVLALMLLICGTANAAATKLVVAHDCTWPPMEFINSKQQLAGYSVDYIDAIAKEMGITVEHKNVAWGGIFAGLTAGRYDVIASSVTITEERKKSMDFSTPYYEVKQAVILPKAVKASKAAELKGKTIGVQIGTTGHFAVNRMRGNKVKARTYDDINLAMEALSTGRLDGVICDDPVAADYVLQRDKYAAKFKIAFIIEEGEKEYYGFAVKKDNQAVLKILNEGIAKIKANGTEQKIIDKWFK